MKNKYYIPYNLDNEGLKKLSETALGVQIRLVAHVLDKQMQFASTRKKTRFTQTQLNKLLKRTEVYVKNFGDHKPEIQWALRIQELYKEAIEAQSDFKYPWAGKESVPISKEAFNELLTSRRSIRRFTQEVIPDDLLKEVIRHGTWAPSNCNMQAIRYIVVKDPTVKLQIKDGGFTGDMGYCTLAVVANYQFYDDANIDGLVHDSAAAIQNILLACHCHDIGACYVTDNGADTKKIRKLLDIKDHEKVTALIWLGKYDRMPIIPARRDLDDVLEFK